MLATMSEKSSKLMLCSVTLILLHALVLSPNGAQAAGDCPSATKVQNCTPKCLHDSECSTIGGKCCPNLCNGRSCAQPNVLSAVGGGVNTSPFNKNSAATGSYCGNVKCSAFEKCQMDRNTKRPQCVRN